MRFEKKLRQLLKRSISNQYTGNFREWPDFIYDDYKDLKVSKLLKIKHRAKTIIQKNKDADINEYLQQFDIKGLGETYDLLSDNYSKKLLVRIIAFRMLGPSKIMMPLTDRKHWGIYFEINNLKQKDKISSKYYNFNLFDLKKIGYDFKLFYDKFSIFINFGLKQYEYSRGTDSCKVDLGDYVVDGGSCFGDTALYFANQIGLDGKVFAFEFIPDNLRILQTNLDINPKLKKNITIVKNPLWSIPKKNLFVVEHGPASTVHRDMPDKYDFKVATQSIDNYVKTQNIKKIDFIKLDIEGAELECLKGAKETISKFQPKLAICLYHDIDHFVSIPKYIHEFFPEYDLFIDHYTIHLGETVMYGVPKKI